MRELAELASRYRSFRFTAVDNILDLRFHKTLFPGLVTSGCSYDIFFEVKSGLSAERLRELHAVGVRRIQPGIESLSTHVLQLMNKGVSALNNVNLLRWSAQLGLDVSWNVIWGFPGETQADYELQLGWLQRLSHLQPPVGAGRIWLERFSPLFQARCQEDQPIRPESSLRLAYPATVDLQQAAYFFEYDFESAVDPAVWRSTLELINNWKSAQEMDAPPSLLHRYAPGFLQIDENRLFHECGTYTFGPPYSELYMALVEKPRPVAQLVELVEGASSDDLDRFLRELTDAGLLLQEDGMALALSLPAYGRERRRPGVTWTTKGEAETA
jgi:ribosomal peptide maturation radical SAM protein 1